MIYADWVNAVADLLDILQTITAPTSATPSTDTNFNQIIPSCINYVENRIQRDLDLLATRVTDANAALTANNRLVAFPTDVGVYLVIEEIIPVVGGVNQPPLLPVSRDYLDTVWPSNTPPTTPSIPTMWCMFDNANALVAPPPDIAYPITVVGTQRVPQMSSSNTSNFLTLQLPDLYICASMIYLTGYQRDFGTQSSDSPMSVSWESQYKLLLTGAGIEEFRKKWQSIGWSSRFPSPADMAAMSSIHQ